VSFLPLQTHTSIMCTPWATDRLVTWVGYLDCLVILVVVLRRRRQCGRVHAALHHTGLEWPDLQCV